MIFELWGICHPVLITRRHRPFFVDLLTSFITSAKFTRHEFEEYVQPVVESEVIAASADPAVRALEAAHALAFRSGLGSSIFASQHSAVTVEDIKAFATSAFSQGNVAVLGTGIDQATLSKLVEKAFTSGSAPTSSPSSYFGGETRVEGHGGPQTVFIGYGVAGPSDPALAALAAHISPEPSLKWSKGLSPFAELPAGTFVQSVYLPYSDATLVGYLVQGSSAEGIKQAGKIAAKSLKEAGGAKAEDLKKAVAKAKFAAASATDSRDTLINFLGSKVRTNISNLLSPVIDRMTGLGRLRCLPRFCTRFTRQSQRRCSLKGMYDHC